MAADKATWSVKLFPKTLLTMLSVALLPFGIYWWFNYQHATVERTETINRHFKQLSDALVHEVDGWVDMNLRVLRQNTALSDIMSMQPAKQVPILTTIAKTYEWLIGAHVIRLDGMSEARSDGQAPRNLGDRRYFQEVIGGKPHGSEVVITRATGKPGLALSAPIYGTEKNIVGVLFLMSHLTDVSRAVTDVKIGATGFALLLDETGQLIAHGRSETVGETLQDMRLHPALRRSEAAQSPVVYEEQGKRILAHTQKTRYGWTLITQQEYDEAFAPLVEARRYGLLLFLVTVVLFSVLAYILSQRLASPIRQLTATAEQISLGELDKAVVGTERGDEIGSLARAIDRLGVSMQMACAALRNKTAA